MDNSLVDTPKPPGVLPQAPKGCCPQPPPTDLLLCNCIGVQNKSWCTAPKGHCSKPLTSLTRYLIAALHGSGSNDVVLSMRGVQLPAAQTLQETCWRSKVTFPSLWAVCSLVKSPSSFCCLKSECCQCLILLMFKIKQSPGSIFWGRYWAYLLQL